MALNIERRKITAIEGLVMLVSLWHFITLHVLY